VKRLHKLISINILYISSLEREHQRVKLHPKICRELLLSIFVSLLMSSWNKNTYLLIMYYEDVFHIWTCQRRKPRARIHIQRIYKWL